MCASTLNNHWLYRETAAVQLVVTILFIKNTRYGLTCLLNLSAHFRNYSHVPREANETRAHTHTHNIETLRYNNHEAPGTDLLSLSFTLIYCTACVCVWVSMDVSCFMGQWFSHIFCYNIFKWKCHVIKSQEWYAFIMSILPHNHIQIGNMNINAYFGNRSYHFYYYHQRWMINTSEWVKENILLSLVCKSLLFSPALYNHRCLDCV